MPASRTYHIRPVLDGQTLAAALRGLNAKLSWTEARKLIHNRHIQVNGNLVTDEARRLKTGDVVKVFEQPLAPAPSQRDVRVVHIDEDLIIVDKPAGITTLRHSQEQEWDDRRKQRQPTLDEVVEGMLPGLWGKVARVKRPVQASKLQDDPEKGIFRRNRNRSPEPTPERREIPKVRPVHRLDRDTSGLMLFALSTRAEPALVAMFKAHTIQRSYLAVVHGVVSTPMRIESWFVRDRGDGLRGSSPAGSQAPESQRAVTHVEPVEAIRDRYSIVRCRLETGRTHQIRIHLAEAGHMLCGERTYVRPAPDKPAVHETSGAPRQALHSADIEFKHPFSDQTLSFSSSLPKDLANWLERLKRDE
jgi:23S rRNA pseudouridine1911/1915/1917 synthase